MFVSHLECAACNQQYQAGKLLNLCTACGKPLLVRYDLKSAAAAIDRFRIDGRRSGMWRYRALLPVRDDANIVSLGEGWTPTLRATRLGESLGMSELYIKDVAEKKALELHDRTLVIRTSAFFGPWDDYNFVKLALDTLMRGLPFEAESNAIVSPTYVPDLVNASLDLLMDGDTGIWHLANRGEITWGNLAREVAGRAGIPTDLVRSTTIARNARQPRYSVLGTERHALLPSLDNALDRWFSETTLPQLRAVTA